MTLQNLGNIEFLNSFLTLHYLTFGYDENEMDKRIHEPYNISRKFLAQCLNLKEEVFNLYESSLEPTKNKNIKRLYEQFLNETKTRGFEPNREVAMHYTIYTEEFEKWCLKIRNHPTYIREITSTNFLGDYDISYADDEIIGFDYPVRASCKLLNEKGYLTYWSSANIEDANKRESHVIENKNAAYILIDSKNLNRSLKEELLLTGDCDFWGIALSHAENGKYYGVWSEITSINMECETLSKNLLERCNDLPVLQKKKY